MVKPIMRDLFFLRQKAEKATKGDFPVAIDLLDTLKAHEDGCVGMAANMIGENKAIIAVNMGLEVEYEDINFKRQRQKYSGWTAQIIQHECDHLNGIII